TQIDATLAPDSSRACNGKVRLSARDLAVPTQPGIISVTVAAACATIAGWILISGNVTAVPMRIRLVTPAIAPNTDHTNGLLPCCDVHGWEWSEIVANEKPDSSAARARWTRSLGLCSSEESVKPISIIPPAFLSPASASSRVPLREDHHRQSTVAEALALAI